MAATNIGMMDGAYFVGRNEILAWINTTLQLGLSKVEEVSDASSNSFPFPISGCFCFVSVRDCADLVEGSLDGSVDGWCSSPSRGCY